MHPANRRGRRRTFSGQVAYRVKHKIVVKVVVALLKLAAFAFLGLIFAMILLLLYIAQTI